MRPGTGSSRPPRATSGRLTAWFNNAGVGDDGRLADLSDEQVQPAGRGQPARLPVGDARGAGRVRLGVAATS